MSRFSEIEAFIAVVETGSLSSASARLGIAISAVSRRLDMLESRLGVRLANRSTRGLSPTVLGSAYFSECRRIMADLADADAGVMGDEMAAQGVFRIAAPLEFGVRYLGPILNRFAATRPDLTIDLDLSDRQVDLTSEGFDFAIRIAAPGNAQFVARELFDIQSYVAASPGFWDHHGRPHHPDDLAGLPALAYRAGSEPATWSYSSSTGEVKSVSLKARFISTNCDFLQGAAEDGLGVILEPAFICGDAISSGRLEAVLLDYRWQTMSAYIVYPPGRPMTARTLHLVEYLVQEMNEISGLNLV